MTTYKISGCINEEAVIYIIQNEAYIGKRRVGIGNYEIIFESSSNTPITAVAENISGKIMSFGNITLLDAAGETPNLHAHASIPSVIERLSAIRTDLLSFYDVSEEIMDNLNDVIGDLQSL